MGTSTIARDEILQHVTTTMNNLVRTRQVRGSLFCNLPLLYPDGSFVTVKIDPVAHRFRVSDAGFAYREVEDVDAARSFKRTAEKFAEEAGVEVGDREVFVLVSDNQLERAVCDVAEVSWRIADQICNRAFDEDETVLADELNARLVKIFGSSSVQNPKIVLGASTTEWPVSAVVSFMGHAAIFQAVSNHAGSIYKASTAFRDLAILDPAPRLIAFVRDKKALGTKLALLAPGKIIEESQADEILKRAAA